MSKLHATVLSFLLLLAASPLRAESPASLHDTIAAADKALFDAFNACDLKTWKRYLADDIEFYQDNDKVTTTRAQLLPSFKGRCGPNNVSKLRRELVPGTLEVYPIKDYGAVEIATHKFWIVEPGKPDELTATPKLVHVWHNNHGKWQITRVISYGH